MSMKQTLKDIVSINSRFNSLVYQKLSSKTPEMARLIEQFGSLDTLADVSELRAFRAEVAEHQATYYTTDANWSNASIYGIWQSMFGGHDDTPLYQTPAVEHGLIFHDMISTDVHYTSRASVATFGQFRKQIIQRHRHVPVFCVGPYIQYADDYYSEQRLAEEKAKLGKTLLVFPAHGNDASVISRDETRYMEAVREVAKDFDSVLVSAFWWDVNAPIMQAFEAEGYRIVSAGFRDDARFLSRSKTMFKLSDLVVGDEIGTHVGYALKLGVPYRLIPRVTEKTVFNSQERATQAGALKITGTIGEAFVGASEITEEQLQACEPYWGLSISRSREELDAIVDITAQIVRDAHGWTGRFWDVAESRLRAYHHGDPQKYMLLSAAL